MKKIKEYFKKKGAITSTSFGALGWRKSKIKDHKDGSTSEFSTFGAGEDLHKDLTFLGMWKKTIKQKK